MNDSPFRSLPAVNDVLALPWLAQPLADWGHAEVVASIRTELVELRASISAGEAVDREGSLEQIARRAIARLEQQRQPKLRCVINATGIVLHTNLGRAPLAEAAACAAAEAGAGYLNLELDLEAGKRSSRQVAVREWLCRLTGAESATAVNNNAAATVLALRALCRGREVVISRGQLIEIGGSFRIPEIMAVSGAVLREVGTTNITRLADYEEAIGPATAALMQVHTSNYRIRGFTSSVTTAELAALAKKHALLVIDDIGSGALVDFARFGFEGEPVACDSIAAGADVVLFSADKLLGGPQAGILAGRQDLIQKIEKDPLMRALRLDKMTLAALEATLRLYLNPEAAVQCVPVLRMLGTPLDTLEQRARALASRLAAIDALGTVSARLDDAYVGGGSLPDQALKSWVVELSARQVTEAALAQRLRTGLPAVLARISGQRLLFDVRTIFPSQEPELVEAVRRALES